jgi:hypothetical protein
MRLRTLPVALLLVSGLVVSALLAACSGAGRDAGAAPVAAVRPATTTSTAPTTVPTTTTTTAPPLSPLTGRLIEDPAVRTRPVVAVKIDNVDGRSTPQMGINAADVVYEVQVEGQITRLLSLFHSTDAGPIGPVRSARGTEIGLLEELNAPLFAWHGANAILRELVRSSMVVPRSFEDVPEQFFRHGGRPVPYNSFVHGTAQIRATAPAGATGPAAPIFAFAAPGQPPSPLAVPASTVTIRWPPPFARGGGEAPVTYSWDGSLWRRSQKGRPHVDTEGRQVAVENVIVRFVQALDSGTVDSMGTPVPTAQLFGSNVAWVFSQGTVTVGTWVKSDATAPTRYLDQQGNEIRLTPGRTWVALPYDSIGSSFG